MERVVRPGVFVLAALIWGLLFVGETLLCKSDLADADRDASESVTAPEEPAVE